MGLNFFIQTLVLLLELTWAQVPLTVVSFLYSSQICFVIHEIDILIRTALFIVTKSFVGRETSLGRALLGEHSVAEYFLSLFFVHVSVINLELVNLLEVSVLLLDILWQGSRL